MVYRMGCVSLQAQAASPKQAAGGRRDVPGSPAPHARDRRATHDEPATDAALPHEASEMDGAAAVSEWAVNPYLGGAVHTVNSGTPVHANRAELPQQPTPSLHSLVQTLQPMPRTTVRILSPSAHSHSSHSMHSVEIHQHSESPHSDYGFRAHHAHHAQHVQHAQHTEHEAPPNFSSVEHARAGDVQQGVAASGGLPVQSGNVPGSPGAAGALLGGDMHGVFRFREASPRLCAPQLRDPTNAGRTWSYSGAPPMPDDSAPMPEGARSAVASTGPDTVTAAGVGRRRDVEDRSGFRPEQVYAATVQSEATGGAPWAVLARGASSGSAPQDAGGGDDPDTVHTLADHGSVPGAPVADASSADASDSQSGQGAGLHGAGEAPPSAQAGGSAAVGRLSASPSAASTSDGRVSPPVATASAALLSAAGGGHAYGAGSPRPTLTRTSGSTLARAAETAGGSQAPYASHLAHDRPHATVATPPTPRSVPPQGAAGANAPSPHAGGCPPAAETMTAQPSPAELAVRSTESSQVPPGPLLRQARADANPQTSDAQHEARGDCRPGRLTPLLEPMSSDAVGASAVSAMCSSPLTPAQSDAAADENLASAYKDMLGQPLLPPPPMFPLDLLIHTHRSTPRQTPRLVPSMSPPNSQGRVTTAQARPSQRNPDSSRAGVPAPLRATAMAAAAAATPHSNAYTASSLLSSMEAPALPDRLPPPADAPLRVRRLYAEYQLDTLEIRGEDVLDGLILQQGLGARIIGGPNHPTGAHHTDTAVRVGSANGAERAYSDSL